MKKSRLFLWVMLLALAQVTVVRYIEVFGVVPQLLFVFSICIAILDVKWSTKLITASCCGVVMDLISGGVFGILTLLYMGCAALFAGIYDLIYRKNILVRILLIFLVTLMAESVCFVVCGMHMSGTFGQAFWDIILPTALYNVVALLVMDPFVKRMKKSRR